MSHFVHSTASAQWVQSQLFQLLYVRFFEERRSERKTNLSSPPLSLILFYKAWRGLFPSVRPSFLDELTYRLVISSYFSKENDVTSSSSASPPIPFFSLFVISYCVTTATPNVIPCDDDVLSSCPFPLAVFDFRFKWIKKKGKKEMEKSLGRLFFFSSRYSLRTKEIRESLSFFLVPFN